MKTMGDVISNRRKEKGMTQLELATKMNITDKAVSKWERNLSCPDVNSISKLAETLGIPVEELLNAKKFESPNQKPAEIVSLILKAIPLAMGIAVVVLSVLDKIDTKSSLIMLGVGLACLGVGALYEGAKKA